MERVMVVRSIIDGLIERMAAGESKDLALRKRHEFIHSYGTAAFARLLALKRGLEPELAAIAGHLYDIGKIVHHSNDSSYATIGALEAERVLRKTSRFSEAEISIICNAIRSQNATGAKGTPYEELLKDATLLENYFHDININYDSDQQNRLIAVLSELGMA